MHCYVSCICIQLHSLESAYRQCLLLKHVEKRSENVDRNWMTVFFSRQQDHQKEEGNINASWFLNFLCVYLNIQLGSPFFFPLPKKLENSKSQNPESNQF